MQTSGDATDFSQLGMGSSLDSLQALGGGASGGASPNLLQQLQTAEWRVRLFAIRWRLEFKWAKFGVKPFAGRLGPVKQSRSERHQPV